MDSIHNMHVVNTDALTYQGWLPNKFPQNAQKEKNRKYLEACLNQRRRLYPFVVSLDGLIGVDSEDTPK